MMDFHDDEAARLVTDGGRAALDERLEQLADATGQRVWSKGAAHGRGR